MDTLFLICAVIGGTILVCQFVLTAMGIGDDGGGDAGDVGDFDAGADVGDVDGGDVAVDANDAHSMSEAGEFDAQHTSTVWLFEIISLRTVVAALAFFGLAGMAGLEAGLSNIQSLIIAIIVGWLAMYAVYSMLKAVSRLQSKGNVRITGAVGSRGTAYVPIPGNQSGAGKVTIKIQNRTMEYPAQTSEKDTIPTGAPIEVVEILGPDLVKVSRVKESITTNRERTA